jgi:hypothetical protein
VSSTDRESKQLSTGELETDRCCPSSPFFLTSIQSWQWTVWISPAKLTSEANSTTSAANSTSSFGKQRERVGGAKGSTCRADGGQIGGHNTIHSCQLLHLCMEED